MAEDVNETPLSEPVKVGVSVKVPTLVLMLIPVELIVRRRWRPR